MSSITKPDLCNALAIRKAARHITALYDRHLAESGLKVTQFSVLARLRHLGPRTINELAADMAMDRTTMGRNIRPLEREGLVRIATDPRDARRRALSITEAGRDRLRLAGKGWAAAQARFDEAYGAERATALRETLAGVIALDFDGAR
ncbi:MarR family winged helix-turn-helix transcriptional regulator [Enterovirga aerilata]|uniref:Winged helix-turn-helix transcriptional regulator n=1 Tax=Enterovirga aerilata TaxID=2730920 RepID=A0A849I2I9_9HYPH|nr:MarR family winged helix-turn-helix transcriptional regulator [Enterovirga sp. DB1703]NNM71568.1 winged helix-turn-helix transcriptional regulator [Enterovirga sp. DB1703]